MQKTRFYQQILDVNGFQITNATLHFSPEPLSSFHVLLNRHLHHYMNALHHKINEISFCNIMIIFSMAVDIKKDLIQDVLLVDSVNFLTFLQIQKDSLLFFPVAIFYM